MTTIRKIFVTTFAFGSILYMPACQKREHTANEKFSTDNCTVQTQSHLLPQGEAPTKATAVINSQNSSQKSQQIRPPQPSDFVDHLLKAVVAMNFDSLYQLDYQCQVDRSQIAASNPKFAQETKLREHYAIRKKEFYDRVSGIDESYSAFQSLNTYFQLAKYLKLAPTTNFIEVDRSNPEAIFTYVKLSFESPEKSPLDGDLFHGPIFPLKEIVQKFQFDSSGLFMGGECFTDATVMWKDLPIKIVWAWALGPSYDFSIHCKTINNQPVKKASIKIGTYSIKQSDIELNYNYEYAVFARVGNVLNEMQIASSRNIPATITVTGSDGTSDTISIIIPDLNTVNKNYLRSPWHETEGWSDTTSVMSCGGSAGEKQPAPRPAQESKRDIPSDRMQGEKFPETRLKQLSDSDVDGISLDGLRDAINEMFARHGADFSKPEMKRHFQQFPWYKPNPGLDFDQIEASFSDLEKANLKLLGSTRDAKTARKPLR